MIKLLVQFSVPLVGPRGGKIPISLNKLKPKVNKYSKAPAWATYKRVKDFYLKNVKICYEERLKRANETSYRHVMFIRNIGKRGRLLDDDNFIGGLKPLRDVLTEKGYIWDDDAKSLKAYYKQVKTENPFDSLTIRIGEENG